MTAIDFVCCCEQFIHCILKSISAVISCITGSEQHTAFKCGHNYIYEDKECQGCAERIEMRLAEALLFLDDLQNRQIVLENRITQLLMVQTGEEKIKSEDLKELMRRFRALSEECSRLEAAINHTNDINTLETDEGRITFTEAMAKREYFKDLASFLRGMGSYAVQKYVWECSSRHKVPQLSSTKLYSDADSAARSLRGLRVAIERSGWFVPLDGYLPKAEF